MCGTPEAWRDDEKKAVGLYILAHAGEPGLDLLVAEYDRLNAAVKTCRGEK